MTEPYPEFEINALRELSRKVGVDPLQVQAAGGNTSVKLGDRMWIKASGTCLADACDSDLFVPVQLDALRQALLVSDPRAEKSVDFVEQALNPNGLRPSIETTVHAVLPQNVVVHVHCVDTIALAVQTNGKALLQQLLASFNWLWVPYRRPGLPLSKYIASALTRGVDADVVVLGNHGLVVAADSVPLAEALLQRVRDAIKQPVKKSSPPVIETLSKLSKGSQYLPAEELATHAVAMDKASLSIAAGGSLYPDHVIFLGNGTTVANQGQAIDQIAKDNKGEKAELPLSIVVPEVGVLMHKEANDSQFALARCLSDVCRRVPDGAAINYLEPGQVHELLHWEAESYRQSLAQ